MPTGDGQNLLRISLKNLRHEDAVEINAGEDISIHQHVKLLCHLRWVFSPIQNHQRFKESAVDGLLHAQDT